MFKVYLLLARYRQPQLVRIYVICFQSKQWLPETRMGRGEEEDKKTLINGYKTTVR
jgi:hypothetical protein